jgi:hypothetical protein
VGEAGAYDTRNEPRERAEDLFARVESTFRRAECEHVAALLKSLEELPGLQASFLSLGAARNGWLVHGSLPGHASSDAQRLAQAGLDVRGLMARGQLEIMELDLTATPDEWVRPWSAMLDERLEAGFDALWFTRFPVFENNAEIAGIVPFEEAWMRCFKGRSVVTLCPYVLSSLSADLRELRYGDIARAHDRVVDLAAPPDSGE